MTTRAIPRSLQLKSAIEYPLPSSGQTHEIVCPTPGLLLVSQQPSSALVKLQVDPMTGQPIAAVRHVIDDEFAGLHGLHLARPATDRPAGAVWITLQFSSELLLIDPVTASLDAAPRVLQRIRLRAPARGPHVVVEDERHLWVSCKDSRHIVRVSLDDPDDQRVIACGPRPIFVAVHPRTGDVWATLDQSSGLFRIPAGQTHGETIPIPAAQGSTPVGMVPGTDGNLWFVLLGGTGTFGRIGADNTIRWFQLTAGAAMGAAFIHLAFNPSEHDPNGPLRLYLLGSSMADRKALNAVFEVELGPDEEQLQIARQQTIAFPSQSSMSHRVLATPHGLYCTALGACAVVHLTPARSPFGEGIDEMSDPYALWGAGVPRARVDYVLDGPRKGSS